MHCGHDVHPRYGNECQRTVPDETEYAELHPLPSITETGILRQSIQSSRRDVGRGRGCGCRKYTFTLFSHSHFLVADTIQYILGISNCRPQCCGVYQSTELYRRQDRLRTLSDSGPGSAHTESVLRYVGHWFAGPQCANLWVTARSVANFARMRQEVVLCN
jgi:hypothetical protein